MALTQPCIQRADLREAPGRDGGAVALRGDGPIMVAQNDICRTRNSVEARSDFITSTAELRWGGGGGGLRWRLCV